MGVPTVHLSRRGSAAREVHACVVPFDVGTVDGEAREFVDDDIELDTTYQYAVVAVGPSGESQALAPSGGAQVCACFDADNEPIEDAALAQAIRDALSIATGPTCADLVGLVNLDANERGIGSLKGLQHAENLEELGLDRNEISSVARLAGLGYLRGLWLGGNQIEDISPLAGLTQLEGISLWDNPLDSIEALRDMDGLVRAYVGALGTDVDHIPLSGKPELRILHIDNNDITDLSFLTDSVDLVVLQANDNAITDASILGDMTGLTHPNLGRNDISDISIIDGLDQLLGLSIYENPVTDHTPVHQHTRLEVLNLGSTGLTDISFLASSANLENLGAWGNPQ